MAKPAETDCKVLKQADHAMAILEALADVWSAEAGLTEAIKAIVSPMNLNATATATVRGHFAHRMEVQIDAIVRQGFIQGAYRAVTGLQDERQQMLALGIDPDAGTSESQGGSR